LKFKVKVGSLRFEQGTFERGDVFDVLEDRAAMFDPNDIAPFLDVEDGKSLNRPMILALKQQYGNSLLNGAEIGVFEGFHAKNILQNLNISTLHLIDPYTVYMNHGAKWILAQAKLKRLKP
jgi:hypothetical protein